jgi:predicted metalloprotease with PDZ domain
MFIHALLALAMATGSLPNPVPPQHAATTPRINSIHRHTTFGVAIAPVPASFRATGYLEANEGVVLTEVEFDGAAYAAKLRTGDLVLAINGKRVDETTLFSTLRAIPRGQAFKIEFLRGSRWQETWAVIDG